jgi:hypothetical protein
MKETPLKKKPIECRKNKPRNTVPENQKTEAKKNDNDNGAPKSKDAEVEASRIQITIQNKPEVIKISDGECVVAVEEESQRKILQDAPEKTMMIKTKIKNEEQSKYEKMMKE